MPEHVIYEHRDEYVRRKNYELKAMILYVPPISFIIWGLASLLDGIQEFDYLPLTMMIIGIFWLYLLYRRKKKRGKWV